MMTGEMGKVRVGAVLGLAYVGAAVVYAVYGTETGTGLPGYLIDWQLRLLGSAGHKLTALMSFGIYLIPLGVLGLVFPAQGFALLGLDLPGLEEAAIAKPTAPPTPARAPRRSSAWLILIVASLSPALIGYGVYRGVMYADEQDQQRRVFKIDLGQGPALPPADAKFVELTSALLTGAQYRYKDGQVTYTVAPLIDRDWEPERPVTYFISTTATYDPRSRPVVRAFQGKLIRDDLPVFVRNEFQRAGLRIASPYYVLHPMTFTNGKIESRADSDLYWLIPIIGVGVGLVILVFGGLILILRARGF